MNTELDNKKMRINSVFLFAKLSLGFILFLIIVVFSGYKIISSSVRNDIEEKEKTAALITNKSTNEILNQIRSDVAFLSKQVELFYHYESYDFKRHLKETFFQFAKSKGFYNQIRYINKRGMEFVRIDYVNGEVLFVPDESLQDKSNRYYFTDILNLDKGSIYFSVFDLNIENGEIEIPYKPMIRIGSPVFDSEMNKTGIVIVNYFGHNLLEVLKNESSQSPGHTFLLNNEGYYFVGPTPDDEWGFMFPDKKGKTFINDFKEESSIIFKEQSGSFLSKKGMFVFSTIGPITQLASNNLTVEEKNLVNKSYWKIVNYIPKQELREATFKILRPWVKVVLVFTALVLILLWILARNIQLKKKVSLDLVTKNRELDEMVKTKDKFFSIIAHDLKSPFNSLLGFSHLLYNNREQLSEKDLKTISKALYNTSRNTFNLLENLLEWSRIQTGKLTPKPDNFKLDDCLKEMELLMSDSSQKKGISLYVEKNSGAVAYADEDMIKTVLRNLLSNAIKFTPKGGKITVSVTSKPGFIEISVADTGIGMNSQDIEQLFNSGQVDSKHGTEDEKGTGLGLMLCKEFIEKNNGAMRVESTMGKGSNFIVNVPSAK